MKFVFKSSDNLDKFLKESKKPKDLINEVEIFLEEADTKLYLIPSSKGILKYEMQLAKQNKPNELFVYFEKFKLKRESDKKKILKSRREGEDRDYEKYLFFKGKRTSEDMKKELIELEKRFNILSHREHGIPIGEHTQRKYRIQNECNGVVKLMNLIEYGLKRDEKEKSNF
jgi:hypothetical protein